MFSYKCIYSWSYLHTLPSLSPRLVLKVSFNLVAMGAYAFFSLFSPFSFIHTLWVRMLVTPSRHKEKFAQPKSAACPVGIILPMRQPLVQLCVQLGVQCSYVCSRECSQLRNRSALTTAGRQPAAKKNDLRGRPRTTTSPLNFIFLLFFPIVGSKAVWESERESRYENAARGCDAENPAPTARSTVPAPGARGHVIHVIRAREGGEQKSRTSPPPPAVQICFLFS